MSFYSFEGDNPVAEHEHFMKLALQEAQKAFELDEVPIGAIVVSQNKVIGRGHNLTETLKDVTAHAEMQAFTAAAQTLGGKFLKDCTLYVTIEPCVMCAGASYWTQIGKIVFGAREEKRGFLSKNPQILHPKTSYLSGILEEDCAALMKRFFQSKRT